jgi:hypothetical protein
VGAEVDVVVDEIDVGVGMMYGIELVLWLEWGLELVLVTELAQAGAVFVLGLQVGVFKFCCSSRGVCRSGIVNSWFPSFDGVSLPTT